MSLYVDIVSYDVEDSSSAGLHVEDGSFWMLSVIWASWWNAICDYSMDLKISFSLDMFFSSLFRLWNTEIKKKSSHLIQGTRTFWVVNSWKCKKRNDIQIHFCLHHSALHKVWFSEFIQQAQRLQPLSYPPGNDGEWVAEPEHHAHCRAEKAGLEGNGHRSTCADKQQVENHWTDNGK